MGKVASDKCHKWVFKESPECEVGISNYWQSSFDAHPPEWLDQFAAGIQTIAVIQAGQGLLQLGSCKVIAEDLHFVLRMRHAFESLDYPSGVFALQPFRGLRSVTNASLYTPGLLPPPSPHSWSLSTNLASIDASKRAGLQIDGAVHSQAFERIKEDTKTAIITAANKSPRLALAPHSPMAQDPFRQNIVLSPSHHRMPTNFKVELQTPFLTPQKRDHQGAILMPQQQQQQQHQQQYMSAQSRTSQVSSPSSSKLYQRRSILHMQPKFNTQGGLQFLIPPPAPISSLEALLNVQRSPFHTPNQSPGCGH